MFMNFCENLFTTVDSINEYIIVASSKLFIICICGWSSNDSENINTATAKPFGMFSAMYSNSFFVYSLLYSDIFIARYLVNIITKNNIIDFIINTKSMFIWTMNPISIKTSISSECDNISLNP